MLTAKGTQSNPSSVINIGSVDGLRVSLPCQTGLKHMSNRKKYRLLLKKHTPIQHPRQDYTILLVI